MLRNMVYLTQQDGNTSNVMQRLPKRLIRPAKQSSLRQARAPIRYKFRYQVPRNYQEAVTLDQENGHTKWQDAIDLELAQIYEYQICED